GACMSASCAVAPGCPSPTHCRMCQSNAEDTLGAVAESMSTACDAHVTGRRYVLAVQDFRRLRVQCRPTRWWTIILVPIAIGSGQSTPLPSIPIRSVTLVAASDSGVLANITDVRELSDGRLLVNDRTRLRVVLFDERLSTS